MNLYKILRCYKEDGKPSRTIKRGLTKEEAIEHCSRDDTQGKGWFDAWAVDK